MSDESGGIVPPPELDRNPVGWLILGVCMALMVMSELASYFSPNPSMALVRARIQEQLQSDLVVSSVDRPRFERHLAEGVATLRPKLDDSPETQLLYAELRTEQGKPVLPSEIAALKSAKKASERAAYQIYSSQALSRDQARVL
ncbi:MAG TPA: hypothetical protein VMI31_12565, partial [Fimbriimonadaceae bacterium]|nr:hypothetical protein [Fimbriimonadaceae bacterium]